MSPGCLIQSWQLPNCSHPKDGATSWDFTAIDPMTIDFLEATKGHSVILNFSTIPQWMYQTDKPVEYPADPNQVTWAYEQGIELRDPSMKEVADYSARLISWYTKGGFSDEFGKRHESGYHYSIPYWEVLNEIEFEHHINAETYTRLYDETVTAVKKVQPEMKFVGLALATTTDPHYFEYFLDPKNHKPGVPLDFISYHFYAVPTADQTPEVEQFTYFDQAEGFLKTVRYVDTMQDAAHRFCQFSCGVCGPCRRPKFCAGCTHRSLHTVNPQLANGLCFAVRNERPSLDEAEQTPYAAVKSGRNEDGTGMDLVGFTRKCQFCTAK